jgi:hypothetical protein
MTPLPNQPIDPIRQRASFLSSSLRGLLTCEFQARLAGSWASNEAHLPSPINGRIPSLSDVDVMVDEPPTIDTSSTISRAVLNMASVHGVEIQKVSVRHKAEIDLFWNPHRIKALSGYQIETGQFMTFWTLVGAIESLSPTANFSASGRAYHLAKFFFKLCRNTLLIHQISSTNYRELTTEVLTKLIFHPGVTRAYAIKTGLETTLSSIECDAILSDSTWAPLTDTFIDAHSSYLLAQLRNDIRTWYRTGISLNTESYLEQIRKFDGPPDLLPARSKVINDYERRIATSFA